MKEKFDNQEGYCRKLGHHLTFKYCRSEDNGSPCRKVLDCWFEKFEVQAYIEEQFPEFKTKQTQSIRPKTATILDLIQQAQKRQLSNQS